MITRRQANQLRGRISYLPEVADQFAHAGSLEPQDAQYVREEYQRVKREVLDKILNLTKEQAK